MNTLKQKIQSKSAILDVIGLGYIGLPLTVEKVKKLALKLSGLM